EDTGEHHRGNRQHRCSEQREGAEKDGDDRAGENCEEVPRGTRETCGRRGEPDAENQRENRDLSCQQTQRCARCGHGRCSPVPGRLSLPPRRTRPLRPMVRPWIVPSSASITYCHWKSYSPTAPS